MTVRELIHHLEQLKPDTEVVINMTNGEEEGFLLSPLAKVEDIKDDLEREFIMLTGLEYHATSELAQN